MPQPPSPTPLLRVTDLGKSYSSGHFAIRHVSLSFGRRDFVAVIGRSGAGKSTLLRCLNLLVRPTEGTIMLGESDVTRAGGRQLSEVRGRVGMVFQGFNLVRRLSVLDNVLCGRLRFRSPLGGLATSLLRHFPSSERDIAFECLRKVQIEHLALRRADTLSGGQQQRVAIARVLAQEPDVILADEPIASLDPQSAASVMELLRGIHDSRGIPVIVNLHQVDIARTFATRIVAMAAGGVRLDGAPSEISDQDIDAMYKQGPAQQGAPSSPDGHTVETAGSRSMALATGAEL